jgi:hypothetical protein
VQGRLSPIPPRFDSARLVGTWPSRPIRGTFLNDDLDLVIAALQRPYSFYSGLRIRATNVLLLNRLADGACEGGRGRRQLAGEALLAALILTAGVDHHRPIRLNCIT